MAVTHQFGIIILLCMTCSKEQINSTVHITGSLHSMHTFWTCICMANAAPHVQSLQTFTKGWQWLLPTYIQLRKSGLVISTESSECDNVIKDLQHFTFVAESLLRTC